MRRGHLKDVWPVRSGSVQTFMMKDQGRRHAGIQDFVSLNLSSSLHRSPSPIENI